MNVQVSIERVLDRASPQNDLQRHRPKSVTSMRGLPSHGRVRLKTLVPRKNLTIRFATLKVRSLTGRTKELSSVLSPYLFCLVMDALTEKAQSLTPWTFIYADDVAICTIFRGDLEHTLGEWKQQLQRGGIMLSVSKTQYMVCNDPDSLNSSIVIDGQQVTICDEYKYLGTMLHNTGKLDTNIQLPIAAAWLKWREVTGVTCDQRMPVKLKGLIYKTIIRPELTYGSETWALTHRHIHCLQVAEMKMLL
ncbi:uncharacterized protein LOC135194812 [Vanessa tameamea]|uniref:Uncharacterized protein LOC135194812 n=1 Tax=Vanessa tameamea TaxID=334116 RepID=A0ABM4AZZ5_VANTA